VRFWIEFGVASLTGFLGLLTLAWRDWIEGVFHWDPDRHSGSQEWWIVVCLLAVTLLLARTAYAEWRRARPSPA
jgi:hypothetical protein